MKRPQITPLAKLRVGDCFQFAYQAISSSRPEHAPEWEVVELGHDYCAVVPRQTSSAVSGGVPASAARLPKITLVHPLPRPNVESERSGVASRVTTSSVIENVRTYPGEPPESARASTSAPLTR